MIADIILSTALGTVAVCCIGWFISVYYNSKCSCDNCISFKKFLTIYENAPEKVDLYEGHFSYLYWDNAFDIRSSRISFHFSIPDTIRYERWRKKLTRKEEKEKADAVMKKVEEYWAEDAVNAKEQEQTNVDQTR